MSLGPWIAPMALGGGIIWLLGLSSCLKAETITRDMGGPVAARIEQMATMTEARIVGQCHSSCTMLLGLPDACVTKRARLGFHGPGTRSGLPLPHSEWDRVSREMADYYPPALRLWFLTTARHVTGQMIIRRGSELIRLGVKECRP